MSSIKNMLFGNEDEYDLNKKVDDFITWYLCDYLSESKKITNEYLETKKIKNVIDKIAIWFEFKYPSALVLNEKESMKNKFDFENFNKLVPLLDCGDKKILESSKEVWTGILDCAMYLIIERGNYILGPRRGLLFALETKRDISIPVTYMVNYSDSDFLELVELAVKRGVSLNQKCIENYYDRETYNHYFQTITLKEAIIKYKEINKGKKDETKKLVLIK